MGAIFDIVEQIPGSNSDRETSVGARLVFIAKQLVGSNSSGLKTFEWNTFIAYQLLSETLQG